MIRLVGRSIANNTSEALGFGLGCYVPPYMAADRTTRALKLPLVADHLQVRLRETSHIPCVAATRVLLE